MFSAGLLFKATALAAFVATVSADDNCAAIPDADVYGFDLANTNGDINSCDGACAKNDECVTWTWSNYNSGTCWMKSGKGATTAKAAVISAAIVA